MRPFALRSVLQPADYDWPVTLTSLHLDGRTANNCSPQIKMKLIPSQQTQRQLAALRTFLDKGELSMSEPCNCNGQTRHNNGGNYHDEWEFKADGGQFFVRLGSTSEYDNSEWDQKPFVEVLNMIQDAASRGYRF